MQKSKEVETGSEGITALRTHSSSGLLHPCEVEGHGRKQGGVSSGVRQDSVQCQLCPQLASMLCVCVCSLYTSLQRSEQETKCTVLHILS